MPPKPKMEKAKWRQLQLRLGGQRRKGKEKVRDAGRVMQAMGTKRLFKTEKEVPSAERKQYIGLSRHYEPRPKNGRKYVEYHHYKDRRGEEPGRRAGDKAKNKKT